MQIARRESDGIRIYKNGDAFRFNDLEEFKTFLSKYDFDITKIDLNDMIKRVKSGLYFDKYYLQLDSENKKIYEIGITNGAENFASYYENIRLKVSSSELIENVLTFTEASELWGLSDGSVLRNAVRQGRFKEGEYRQSGKVWLVTREAMERVYGKLI